MGSLSDVAVGVDVSVRRGLDVVALDDRLEVIEARALVEPGALGELLGGWLPGVVAIDSPPGRGTVPGLRSRPCERELRRLGVRVYSTPSDPVAYAKPFYDWVRVGEQVYEGARAAGYPLHDDATVVQGRALEVYPHASEVFLRGCLPPPGTTRRERSKRAWRQHTLESAGVDPRRLVLDRQGRPTMDSIDAALAAVTGIHALRGNVTALGEAGAFVVVPGRDPRPLRTCTG